MNNLYSLRALAAVSEAGSITEAARRLRISQPAVTRAIASLEEDLGFPLLERQARGVAFTAKGSALLHHAKLMTQLEQDASRDLLKWMASRPAEVRVAASDVPIATVLPGALRLLRASSPQVQVRIVEAVYPDVLHYFRHDLIDLAIGPLPPPALAERFRVEKLLDAPLVVAVGANRGLEGVRSLGELGEHGWVVQRSVDASNNTWTGIFSAAGVPVPKKVLLCESVSTALQFIETEGFIGLVPEQLTTEACQAGRISILPLADKLVHPTIGVFYPRSSGLTAASQALYSALRMAVHRRPQKDETS